MILSDIGREHLKALGERLRNERLRRNETQGVFAARIGASIPTLLKMEEGSPKVQLGWWVAALDILNRLEDVDKVLATTEDLFDKYERTQEPQRKRASGRKGS